MPIIRQPTERSGTLRKRFQLDEAYTLTQCVIPLAMSILVPQLPTPVHVSHRLSVDGFEVGLHERRSHLFLYCVDPPLSAVGAEYGPDGAFQVLAPHGRETGGHLKL